METNAEQLGRVINGEKEWRRYLVGRFDCLEQKVVDNKVEIAKLKVKAGAWGLMGGLIPVVIYLTYIILRGK